ncbi:MAG: hypothetical protein A2268_01315 [Candidatus Raymondbacteria bacterium RifOxyA12_full_50_37]|uniref:Calcineurin-like phosphoesterase domain-containing protein n=1 Tax=Candidatus Raymondbacteria bacterium RIFOXYD12_FULL_49_13 TaxID=1817890 RepID=A0A1F7FH78_UNCRA|nr:MAG: hypothetical protein A2268_01315 [Candidatus Raymondbacteria bacterium RifOxyA12_full_50_37]OGJ92427.1 MAG: hypothetical protein A2248_11610 [Candidatus Raymondbacteria bacterium RIFOXYA2_FULL_49_16]OGJ98848.1 MAG: hypothetical protein A2453_01040 [Candidatus Raymondbacteria bacterium RIFOXYC2_FULL_50_21]OGK00567.1 MAG: hypothetical protein A2487_08155 [Candidatus Raymondbacteria bacterium RifOxyC12_full_50_8]OGK03577.1 MAG: hypothetical protein A2350_09870 [Candidatus Raymondbacteria b
MLKAVLFVVSFAYVITASPTTQLSAYYQDIFSSNADDTTFTFGVNGDNHINSIYGITAAQYRNTLTTWRTAGCAFVTTVGDWGYGNQADVDSTRVAITSVSNCPPVLFTMGNHEMDGVGKRPWVDSIAKGVVTDWASADGLTDKIYYAFTYGSQYLFIFLDGDYQVGASGSSNGTLDTVQVRWFKEQLEANRDKHVFVFFHEPIEQWTYDTPGYLFNSRGPVCAELEKHINLSGKQAWTFSGHLHYDKKTTFHKVHSVHISAGTAGVVSIDGDNITVNVGSGWTNLDQFPCNVAEYDPISGDSVIRIAEDSIRGMYSSVRDNNVFSQVTAENGVGPVYGTKMMKGPAITWYHSYLFSDQLITVRPNMKFLYSIYLVNVSAVNQDHAGIQPFVVMPDGSNPTTTIQDQNAISFDMRKTPIFQCYACELPSLAGRASSQWYHREFDLSAFAGASLDRFMFLSQANGANFSSFYVDNIKVRWPAPTTIKETPASEPDDDLVIHASPNPFNPAVTISITNVKLSASPAKRGERIMNPDLKIYNTQGQLVKDLTSDIRNLKFVIRSPRIAAGEAGNSVVWDASGQPSGLYVVRATLGSSVFTKTITLMK